MRDNIYFEADSLIYLIIIYLFNVKLQCHCLCIYRRMKGKIMMLNIKIKYHARKCLVYCRHIPKILLSQFYNGLH